jgi:hypothetical protein
MQCLQFHAKSAKNDFKPTKFLKCNFPFETKSIREEIFYSSLSSPEAKFLVQGFEVAQET